MTRKISPAAQARFDRQNADRLAAQTATLDRLLAEIAALELSGESPDRLATLRVTAFVNGGPKPAGY